MKVIFSIFKPYLSVVDFSEAEDNNIWRRPYSLSTSLSLPAECIVLSVATHSPQRKLRRTESTRSKDGRAVHPKPFRCF